MPFKPFSEKKNDWEDVWMNVKMLHKGQAFRLIKTLKLYMYTRKKLPEISLSSLPMKWMYAFVNK